MNDGEILGVSQGQFMRRTLWSFASTYLKKRHFKYLLLLAVLVFSPILRELIFGIFSHHHLPFATTEDIIHTLLEVAFMASLGCLLIFLDIKIMKEKRFELKMTQTVAIEALASLAEYRDAETAEHLLRIRAFIKILTESLKESRYGRYIMCQDEYIEDLMNASVLHDIGKIAVPDAILMKPGRLTEEEFETIKRHTVLGSEILLAADNQFRKRVGKQSYLTLAQSIAKSHHEKWDGSGYPHGLAGDDIPLSARIVALCDVYDAVTSDRVYKKAWPHDQAVDYIEQESGRHFDPILVETFLKVAPEFEKVKQAIN